MKKFSTFAVVAGAALALTACGPEKAAEAPEAPAAPEAGATAEPMAEEVDEAAAAAEGLDPTGNPIGLDKPAGADAMSAEGEAPAAE
jgi:hypothetical protein